jgi:hypothetical protein
MSFADIAEDEAEEDAAARASAGPASSGEPAPEAALLSRIPTSNVAETDRSAQSLGSTVDQSAEERPGTEHQRIDDAPLAHGLDASLQDGAATGAAAGPAAEAAVALAAEPAAEPRTEGISGTVQM